MNPRRSACKAVLRPAGLPIGGYLVDLERKTGIEPVIPTWQAGVSPQHFIRTAGTTGGVGGSRTLKPLRVAGFRDQVRRHVGGATPFRRRVIVLGKAPATRLRSATRGPPASSTGDGHRPVHRALSARGGLGGNRTHVYRFKRPVQDPAFATNPNPAAGTPPARSHVVPPSGIEPEPSALQADAQTTYARAG